MASAATAAELMCLPNEVLTMIFPLALASKTGADLKRLRLMNKRLAFFAKPHLFRWICLSTAGENFEDWKIITQPGSQLRHHVEQVCIDCTSFIPHIGRWRYCRLLAQHLKEYPYSSHPSQDGKGSQRDDDTIAVYTKKNLFSDLADGERATKLPPGDKELLRRGYQEYLLLAQFQQQIRSSCCLYEMLVEGLRSLPRVQAISFMTKWHVDVKAARGRHESEGLHMESEGSNVNLPGPLARQHPSLRLPPLCSRSWSGKHGTSLLVENFSVVLRVVRKLNLDLRTLIGPGANQSYLLSTPHLESLVPLHGIGLPIETFARPEQAELPDEMKELVTGSSSALRKLRKFELSFNSPRLRTRYLYGNPRFSARSYLPDMFRWMPYIELLVLRQHRRLGEDDGVASLNDVFGISELLGHRSQITNPHDHPDFHYPCYGQDILVVSEVPSFPRLRHLELSGFEVSRGGLNSLLKRVSSSLEILKLHNIWFSNSGLWWPFVLDELREIFCKKSPPLELSLRFPKPEFLAVLLNHDVLPHKVYGVRSSEERLRRACQRIERYITLEAEKQTFGDWRASLRA